MHLSWSAQFADQYGAIEEGAACGIGDQSQRGSAGAGQRSGVGQQHRLSAGGNKTAYQGAGNRGAVSLELGAGQRGDGRRCRVDRVVHFIAAGLGKDEVAGTCRMGDLSPQNHLVGGKRK